MEKIEVGEHIRTTSGDIGELVEINSLMDDDMKYVIDVPRLPCYVYCGEKDIKKHSTKLIDLIEKGDFVNGTRIDFIDKEGVFVHSTKGIDVNRCGFSIPIAQNSKDIKTILTYEQYKKYCYVNCYIKKY